MKLLILILSFLSFCPSLFSQAEHRVGFGAGVELIQVNPQTLYGGYLMQANYTYRSVEGFTSSFAASLKGGQKIMDQVDYLYDYDLSLLFGGQITNDIWLSAGPIFLHGEDSNNTAGIRFQANVPVMLDQFNNIELMTHFTPVFAGNIMFAITLNITHNINYNGR